ncbi:hypothetical protein [Oceanimonas smirnovii]|uniref:hypothetical protein n=1 Tax=Oceanimonas smirnovii TaxID=264574 RepID=UPI00376FF760
MKKILILVFTLIAGCNSKIEEGEKISILIKDDFGVEYNFESDGVQHYYTIKHPDGSGGKYILDKKSERYYDTESKFGEYYVVENGEVSIYDQAGFIRKIKSSSSLNE